MLPYQLISQSLALLTFTGVVLLAVISVIAASRRARMMEFIELPSDHEKFFRSHVAHYGFSSLPPEFFRGFDVYKPKNLTFEDLKGLYVKLASLVKRFISFAEPIVFNICRFGAFVVLGVAVICHFFGSMYQSSYLLKVAIALGGIGLLFKTKHKRQSHKKKQGNQQNDND